MQKVSIGLCKSKKNVNRYSPVIEDGGSRSAAIERLVRELFVISILGLRVSDLCLPEIGNFDGTRDTTLTTYFPFANPPVIVAVS